LEPMAYIDESDQKSERGGKKKGGSIVHFVLKQAGGRGEIRKEKGDSNLEKKNYKYPNTIAGT